jgi:hypothetical protein
VQIPRDFLVASLPTEKEDNGESDESKKACDAELYNPEEKEEIFAPFWICGWGAKGNWHLDLCAFRKLADFGDASRESNCLTKTTEQS